MQIRGSKSTFGSTDYYPTSTHDYWERQRTKKTYAHTSGAGNERNDHTADAGHRPVRRHRSS